MLAAQFVRAAPAVAVAAAEPECWSARQPSELQRVLPQAGDDAVHIRDLAAAQTPNIRRARNRKYFGSEHLADDLRHLGRRKGPQRFCADIAERAET